MIARNDYNNFYGNAHAGYRKITNMLCNFPAYVREEDYSDKCVNNELAKNHMFIIDNMLSNLNDMCLCYRRILKRRIYRNVFDIKRCIEYRKFNTLYKNIMRDLNNMIDEIVDLSQNSYDQEPQPSRIIVKGFKIYA